MGVQLKHRDEPITFRRKQKHDLTKLLKKLEREQDAYVDALVNMLESTDEKMRFQAAKEIAALHISVAEHINRDEIQRLLLELKNPEAGKNLLEDDDESMPMVNFDSVAPEMVELAAKPLDLVPEEA